MFCGTTAGSADSKISSLSNRIESESSDSNSNRISKLRRSLAKGLNNKRCLDRRYGHLFVGGERQVSAHQAVAIVSEQNDASLFGVHVEYVEMRRMPSGVDGDRHLDVGQHAVVGVRQRLSAHVDRQQ